MVSYMSDSGIKVRPCERRDIQAALKIFRDGCIDNSQDIFRVFLHRQTARLYISIIAFVAWVFFRSFAISGSVIITTVAVMYVVSYIKSAAYAKRRMMTDLRDIKRNYMDSRKAEMFIAEDDGEVVGTATVSAMKVDSTALELQTLSVSRLYRRSGIGTMLVAAAIKYGKSNRYEKIMSHASESQMAAQRLLEKSGFKIKSRKLTSFFPFFRLYNKVYCYRLRESE
ncbi:probable N-acetyltransferase camello [Ptychodera flava]|uniref:probable N-acetyltransferase camello n=1 Tax=Ptychodera flava TaxID=63121 RepID=UPI00396A7490